MRNKQQIVLYSFCALLAVGFVVFLLHLYDKVDGDNKAYHDNIRQAEERVVDYIDTLARGVEAALFSASQALQHVYEKERLASLLGAKDRKGEFFASYNSLSDSGYFDSFFVINERSKVVHRATRKDSIKLDKNSLAQIKKIIALYKSGSNGATTMHIHKLEHGAHDKMIIFSKGLSYYDGGFKGVALIIFDGSYVHRFFGGLVEDVGAKFALSLDNGKLAVSNFASSFDVRSLDSVMREAGIDNLDGGDTQLVHRYFNDKFSMFAFKQLSFFPIRAYVAVDDPKFFQPQVGGGANGFLFIGAILCFVSAFMLAIFLVHKKALNEKMSQNTSELASKVRSEFLAKMSHELKTPLNAIMGFASLLLDKRFGQINQMQRDRLVDIQTCSYHLLELVNDILEFSRGNQGKLRLKEEVFEVDAMTKDALTFCDQRAKFKNIALTCSTQNCGIRVYADSRKVRQILTNLISNAIKFTKSGGKINVSTYIDSKGNFVMSVADNGSGMDVRKLSESFAMSEDGDDGRSKTMGIGLPLCKILTELHGGKIRIASKIGVGTQVFVVLMRDRVVSKRVEQIARAA